MDDLESSDDEEGLMTFAQVKKPVVKKVVAKKQAKKQENKQEKKLANNKIMLMLELVNNTITQWSWLEQSCQW